MSKLMTIVLCVAVLAAMAMAATALYVGYTTMMMVGLVAFVVICAFGWLTSILC
jgi:hypothetical protein